MLQCDTSTSQSLLWRESSQHEPHSVLASAKYFTREREQDSGEAKSLSCQYRLLSNVTVTHEQNQNMILFESILEKGWLRCSWHVDSTCNCHMIWRPNLPWRLHCTSTLWGGIPNQVTQSLFYVGATAPHVQKEWSLSIWIDCEGHNTHALDRIRPNAAIEGH
jgi:hypothetical protein